ncbi:MAG: hypothetical protein JW772_05095 [Candidatus Diapherotrites archaeon]|nr:hypothetical protein [Candidatus Diapherotrites archaeon]
MNFFLAFLIAFGLTNAIEFVPQHFLVKKKIKPKLLALLFINAITLPIVWLVLPFFFFQYFFALIIIEALVILVEGIALRLLLGLTRKNAFQASIAMNLLSTAAVFFVSLP